MNRTRLRATVLASSMIVLLGGVALPASAAGSSNGPSGDHHALEVSAAATLLGDSGWQAPTKDSGWQAPPKDSGSQELLGDSGWQRVDKDSGWQAPPKDSGSLGLLGDSGWQRGAQL